MSRVIVLKFGGSVLGGAGDLRRAVHEIYRWRRDGWDVVAVPSALTGVTDTRLSEANASYEGVGGHALAAMLATGELESAARLGLELERAGIPARVLSPGACGLRATGDPLDARPKSLHAALVHDTLERHGVIVVPGFVGCDTAGAWVTLGRGGSDLSALFLARELGAARCRLVKDVDGLYEHDPKRPGPKAARFEMITWNDALKLDGSIVQHKAVRFAREHTITFEVTGFNSLNPTLVGAESSRLAPHPERMDPVRVALLGAGTVGGGVLELLNHIPNVEVIGVAVRDVSRERDLGINPSLLSTNPVELAGCGADIVVEAIGGVEPAKSAIARALQSGSDVVTANKGVLAVHGAELRSIAQLTGRTLLASASVGGNVPVLERLRRRSPERPVRLQGVLNGTANYVLNKTGRGESLEGALDHARRLGLAEVDASRDLDGRDASDKLAVVAQTIGNCGVDPASVSRDVIDAGVIGSDGAVLRQVSTIEFDAPTPSARVTLDQLESGDPLADLPDAQNAVEIEWSTGDIEVLRGVGAGRWATSESVVADVLELIRIRQSHERSRTPEGVVRAR